MALLGRQFGIFSGSTCSNFNSQPDWSIFTIEDKTRPDRLSWDDAGVKKHFDHRLLKQGSAAPFTLPSEAALKKGHTCLGASQAQVTLPGDHTDLSVRRLARTVLDPRAGQDPAQDLR
jgi:hypothetical protein